MTAGRAARVPGPRVRRAPGLAAGLATLGLLAGCGVPAEPVPRAIESGSVRALRGSPSPAPQPSGGVAERICLVEDGRLVPVRRQVPGPSTVQESVDNLLAGPTREELAAGATTALGGTSLVTGVRLDDGIAVVGLRSDSGEAARSDDVLAIAQVVCTLTARPDVTGVVFERRGQRAAVPRGDGSLTPEPLDLDDFAGLLAGAEPSTAPGVASAP